MTTVRDVQAPLRLLITGGAGFIGSHVCRHFLAQQAEVWVLDNFSTGRVDNLPADGAGLKVITADVRDADCMTQAGLGTAPLHAIVHLAAQTSVPRSLQAPLEDAEINYGGALRMLDFARQQSPSPVVVFASSAAVYGDVEGLAQVGVSALRPCSPYGLHKWAVEEAMRLYANSYALSSMALRFFNVYGPRQDPSSPYSGVISQFMARAAAGEPLTIHGDGTQTRDFIYVDDVVQAIAKAVHRALRHAGGQGAFACCNVATGRSQSIRTLAEGVAAVFGRPVDLRFAATRAGDIRHSRADVACLARLLGLQTHRDLQAGLAQTAQWYRQAGCDA
ncbi:MAG: NAD-dependent epimerase/dehydratase family protein [Polyangiales bacterium]